MSTSTNTPTHVCPQCKATHKRPEEARDHLAWHLGNSYPCPISGCNNSPRCITSLRRHLRDSTEPAHKQFFAGLPREHGNTVAYSNMSFLGANQNAIALAYRIEKLDFAEKKEILSRALRQGVTDDTNIDALCQPRTANSQRNDDFAQVEHAMPQVAPAAVPPVFSHVQPRRERAPVAKEPVPQFLHCVGTGFGKSSDFFSAIAQNLARKEETADGPVVPDVDEILTLTLSFDSATAGVPGLNSTTESNANQQTAPPSPFLTHGFVPQENHSSDPNQWVHFESQNGQRGERSQRD
jgi:hypothetical protein